MTYCGLDISPGAIKAIVFALAVLVTLPTKGSLMPKFVLLVTGNQMRLKFIFVEKFLLLTNGIGRKLRSLKGCVVYVILIHLSSYAS